MRLRILLPAAVLVALGSQAHAGYGPIPDSIGVERKGNKNLVLYKVESGETLFGITRKYRTTVGEVQRLNAGLAGGVKTGQVIKVPALSNTAPTAATTAKAPEGSTVQKVHVVTNGQTLFAIARKYKVSVANLQLWNNLTSAGLVEGQQLVVSKPDASSVAEPAPEPVAKAPKSEAKPKPEPKEEPKPVAKEKTEPAPAQPSPEPKIAPEAAAPVAESKPGVIKHTVKSGETLYAVARTYNASVDQIKKDNNLGAGGLRVGQTLDIRKNPPLDHAAVVQPAAPIAEKVAEAKGETLDSAAVDSKPSGEGVGYERIVEHGVAELVDNDAGSRNYFCLHRSAPIGKILQVTNEMNGAKVFVRVIGKLPETGNNDKVAIKISRKAFEALAAADKRFPVEISYPNQ